MSAVLLFCARQGRLILAVSLLIGLTSTTLAGLVKPHINALIFFLLFVACLRVGARQAVGALRDMQASLAFTLLLQLALPLVFAVVLRSFGIIGPLGVAIVLLMAAPPLTGSPHLVTLLGFDPAPALRQLVVGTALLPLTTFAVFMMLPGLEGKGDLLLSSLQLMEIILFAAVPAFVLRGMFLKSPSQKRLMQLDGISTILLAVVVVGLMAAINGAIRHEPMEVAKTLAVASGAGFGLQIVFTLILRHGPAKELAVPVGVIAGNRNVALFLTVLPAVVSEPLMLFIACYQIPMYLTPVLMCRFYRR
jgi:hypothetical protein